MYAHKIIQLKNKTRVEIQCAACGRIFTMGMGEYRVRMQRAKNGNIFCNLECRSHFLSKRHDVSS